MSGLSPILRAPYIGEMGGDDTHEAKFHKVAIPATAKVTADMDDLLITLEKQLEPIFKDMDEARLYRIAHGDDMQIPGTNIASNVSTRLIARYWWERRQRAKQERRKRIAIGVGIVAAFAAVISALT